MLKSPPLVKPKPTLAGPGDTHVKWWFWRNLGKPPPPPPKKKKKKKHRKREFSHQNKSPKSISKNAFSPGRGHFFSGFPRFRPSSETQGQIVGMGRTLGLAKVSKASGRAPGYISAEPIQIRLSDWATSFPEPKPGKRFWERGCLIGHKFCGIVLFVPNRRSVWIALFS